MPRAKVSNNAFPVGLFIILALVLLVGGILWLRDFSLRPQYTFFVTYKRPTRLIAGNPIYFRGIRVGRIEKVALAADTNSTDVTMGIFANKLRLSKTVHIHTREELISGQRYIEIVPPDQPVVGEDYIHNGDKLVGIEPVNLDKFEEQLSHIAEHKGIEKLVDSTHETISQLKGVSIETQQFLHNTEGPTNRALKQFTETSRRVSVMANSVNGFTNSAKGAIPKMVSASQRLVSNTNEIPQTLEAVDSAAKQTNKTLTTFNTQLIQSNLLPTLSNTLSEFNTMLGSGNATNLFQSLSQTSARIDCTTAQASHIMGQRFPGFKMLFGKPGGGYSCDNIILKPPYSQASSPASSMKTSQP